MALLAELGGADGITVHLREDRRHIQDRDVTLLRQTVRSRLNLEMAATAEMVAIALEIKPDMVTLVPERREEVTTEGGLDVAGQRSQLSAVVEQLQSNGLPVSLSLIPTLSNFRPAETAVPVGLNSPEPTPKRPGRSKPRLARIIEGCATAIPGLRVKQAMA